MIKHIAVFLLLAAAGAAAQRPAALVVLGDSFSDNGNAWAVTNRTLPSASQGYWQGRFSDNKVWNDYIVEGTGVTVVNTGYPAATACQPSTPNGGMPFYVPYLFQQFGIVANMANSIPRNRAVFIWMGANDLSGLAQGVLGQQLTPDAAMRLIPAIRDCIRQTANSVLASRFTSSLVVSNIQDISKQPIWPTALANFSVPEPTRSYLLEVIGNLTRALNDGIRADIEDLAKMYRQQRVAMFDMYSLYLAIQNTGSINGFSNTAQACLEVDPWFAASGDPSNRVISTCPAPGSYMFWDYSHPSSATHRILARNIKTTITSVSNIFG